MSRDQLAESVAAKFAALDERNRIFTISALDRIFDSCLKGKLLNKAKGLLTEIALDIGEARGEQLRTLFREELSPELPDLQKALVAGLLKDL